MIVFVEQYHNGAIKILVNWKFLIHLFLLRNIY